MLTVGLKPVLKVCHVHKNIIICLVSSLSQQVLGHCLEDMRVEVIRKLCSVAFSVLLWNGKVHT